MRPLFARARPPALPVPAALAFAAARFREESAAEILRADPGARVLEGPAIEGALAFACARPLAAIARDLARSATFTRHVQPLESAEEVRDLAAIARALG